MNSHEIKLLRWMGVSIVSIFSGIIICIAGGEYVACRALGGFLAVCGIFLIFPLWVVWEER